MLLERRKRVVTKPAATEPAASALWLRPNPPKLKNWAEVGPTMPSTIPAAIASAISRPLSVKMHIFLSLSGMLLDRRPCCSETRSQGPF